MIGGGSTGAGVARDAAMRGLRTVLVERRDLADGTTGRFHGLLHSGGRYAVKDPEAAKECIVENLILRRTASDCIGLNPEISRAFTVPDAALDPWKLVWGCARSAQEHGAEILLYHRVLALEHDGQKVTGALVRNEMTGEDLRIHADVVVNAAGAWAGQIAELAGCRVNVLPGKGIMIAMNHRLVNTVVNRCKMPADGDIIVPIRTVCVIGTTDTRVADPDELEVTQAEIGEMLDEGEKLVPGFRESRALRVWAGARPLFSREEVADTREVSRSHALLDHRERDGVEGLVTITGGKTTTFRLMAEAAVDAACDQLGVERPSRTAEEALADSDDGHFYLLGSRLRAREPVPQADEIICECELITRERLEEAMRRRRTANLDDIRRTLRLGMGPCQGGFCTYRATGILHAVERLDHRAANASLLAFLQERWKGVHPVLHGDQVRQARLDDWIFQGLLGVQHLPT